VSGAGTACAVAPRSSAVNAVGLADQKVHRALKFGGSAVAHGKGPPDGDPCTPPRSAPSAPSTPDMPSVSFEAPLPGCPDQIASAVKRRANAMRYLLVGCFLSIAAAFADAAPAAAQQNCACFCRVQGESGGGCWVDVPGCNPRSGVRNCSDGAKCGYICGSPGLPARRSAPGAHPLGEHYTPR
jgi:hypothetical protein